MNQETVINLTASYIQKIFFITTKERKKENKKGKKKEEKNWNNDNHKTCSDFHSVVALQGIIKNQF